MHGKFDIWRTVMIKKLKDITMGEFSETCKSHTCYDCPFMDFSYCDFIMPLEADDMEKEYDLEEGK